MGDARLVKQVLVVEDQKVRRPVFAQSVDRPLAKALTIPAVRLDCLRKKVFNANELALFQIGLQVEEHPFGQHAAQSDRCHVKDVGRAPPGHHSQQHGIEILLDVDELDLYIWIASFKIGHELIEHGHFLRIAPAGQDDLRASTFLLFGRVETE